MKENKKDSFFEKEGWKKFTRVLSWVFFGVLIDLALRFIAYPWTFALILVLALIVMPSITDFLKNNGIKFNFVKKLILWIIVFFTAVLVTPLEDDSSYMGIEGVTYLINNNSNVVLENEELEVVEYAVNYYYDNVLKDSVVYSANLNDVIVFYEDKSYDGEFLLVDENNFPLEITSSNLKDNVINIYYQDKDIYEASLLFQESLSTEETAGLVEETKVEWDKKTITSSTYEEVKDMLNKKVDASTEEVVYTIEYSYDGVIDDNLTTYFIVPIGSKVNECPHMLIDGFVFDSYVNCPVVLRDNNQVVRVKYVSE